ncbi:MAG: hypothetical protein D6687_11100 [Acidobacteria bacterium]|jgi:hypothetical protein|nr:MAG: hypothetical protein D6687_11100 [Acidobacteriota bacterium]GIU83032.1 MAG: hypothetical protein KatS3mg006_2096 [Pyrinomonadaceae bacterium]
MLGVLILIFLIFRISRSAKRAGKKLIFWIPLALVLYIGIQSAVAGSVVLISLIGERMLGWQPIQLGKFALPILFFSEVFSLLAVWTIANYLTSEAEDRSS